MSDLLARLISDDPEVKLAALLEAGALRDLEGRDAIIEGVIRQLSDPHPGLRQAALDMLGHLSTFAGLEVSESVVAEAIRLTRDPTPKVRAEAAASLALLSEDLLREPRIEALVERLKDPDAEVRQEALAALGDLRADSAVDPIAVCLNDANRAVQFEAAFALASLKDARALEPLLKALTGTRRRLDACEALRRLGDVRAVDPLRALTQRWFLAWVDRLTLWATLHALGAQDAGEEVVLRTRSRRPEERSYALALIGSHQIHVGRDTLVAVAEDARDPHRDTAVRALGELGGPEAREVLEKLQKHSDLPEDLASDVQAALDKLPVGRS